jgi:TatA/E family protein of Tat protein translocase
MGIENPVHLLFIAIVALIVLGPRRLPELTRAVGRGVREFREAIGQQGSPPDHVIEADSQVDEELAPGHAAIGPEPTAAPVPEPAPASVPEPAAASRPASESQTVGAATIDPAQPVRSGDAPDRRPL